MTFKPWTVLWEEGGEFWNDHLENFWHFSILYLPGEMEDNAESNPEHGCKTCEAIEASKDTICAQGSEILALAGKLVLVHWSKRIRCG